MIGKHHIIFGTIASIGATSIITKDLSLPIVVFAALGSVFPDLDIETSVLGKHVKPLSKGIKHHLLGHRGLLHTPFLILFPTIFYFWMTKHPIAFSSYFIAFVIGFFFHLLQDTFTSRGISWLYPFSRKRFSLWKVKSGHYTEALTSMMLVAIVLLIVWNIH